VNNLEEITNRSRQILSNLPKNVSLIAAGKGHSLEQLEAAIAGGITIIGHNYVQEAEATIGAIGRKVEWRYLTQ